MIALNMFQRALVVLTGIVALCGCVLNQRGPLAPGSRESVTAAEREARLALERFRRETAYPLAVGWDEGKWARAEGQLAGAANGYLYSVWRRKRLLRERGGRFEEIGELERHADQVASEAADAIALSKSLRAEGRRNRGSQR
jgi:hypothetical protein